MKLDKQGPCPIWRTPASLYETGSDSLAVESGRAGGRYFVTGTANVMLADLDDGAKRRLTTWLVDQRKQGDDCPRVDSETLKRIKLRPYLSVWERAERLLQYMENFQSQLGEDISVFADTWPDLLAHSESQNQEELFFLLEGLEKKGLVVFKERISEAKVVRITMDGSAYLEELTRRSVVSSQAFVAMWFDGSMEEIYTKGLAAGIREAGYEPVRIDQKEHNSRIDDAIIAEIRRSRFVVADFTQGTSGARGGVYYEAGFAHGFNLPVIFTCREDAIRHVHFDTRQYNHILWTSADDLRDKLSKRISATIGDGPLRRNPESQDSMKSE